MQDERAESNQEQIAKYLRMILDASGVQLDAGWRLLMRYPRYKGEAVTMLEDGYLVNAGAWNVDDCSMGHELKRIGSSSVIWGAWRLAVGCKGVRLEQMHIAEIAWDGSVLAQLTKDVCLGWRRNADPEYLISVLEQMLAVPTQRWDVIE